MHVAEKEPHPVIPPVERFSSWTSFVHNTAVVMQAPWVMCKKRNPGPPTTEEKARAEAVILRWAQEELDLRDKFVVSLSPTQDENGLWRMGSRLGNARFLTYDAKYPIILPRHHGGHPFDRPPLPRVPQPRAARHHSERDATTICDERTKSRAKCRVPPLPEVHSSPS